MSLHPWTHCDITKRWNCDGEPSRCFAEPHSCQTDWVTAPGPNNSVSLSLFLSAKWCWCCTGSSWTRTQSRSCTTYGKLVCFTGGRRTHKRDKRSGSPWMFSLWQHRARMCLCACVKSHVGKDYMCFFGLLLLNMLHISIRGGDLLFPNTKSHINRCGHSAGWLHETHCRLKNCVVNLNLGSTIAASIQLKRIPKTFNWIVGKKKVLAALHRFA